MKSNRILTIHGLLLAAMLSLSVLAASGIPSNDDQHSFSYIGQLSQKGIPYSGTADVNFTLWDAQDGGTNVSTTKRMKNIQIIDGIFKVPLSFDDSVFAKNESRWLEVSLRAPAGKGSFTTLSPRREVSRGGSLNGGDNNNQLTGGDEHNLIVAPDWFINAPNSIYLNIDANNDSTTAILEIAKDRTGDTGGTTLFKVQEDGRVGIGTAAPNEMLSVNGMIESMVGIKFPDLTVQVTAFEGTIDWVNILNMPVDFADGIDNDTTYTPGQGLDLSSNIFSLDQQGAIVGEVLKWDGGGWSPGVDIDTDTNTTYSAGQGLDLTGTIFSLHPQGATNGQVLKWNGSAWTPGSDIIGSSYWNQSGSDIYFNTGRVGIGVSSPNSILHVEGTRNNGEIIHFENHASTVAFALYAQQGAGSQASLGLSAAIVGESEHGAGVAGFSEATDGAGLFGSNTAQTGVGIGVSAVSDSVTGEAVSALAQNQTGVNYAVNAHTNSSNGYSAYFTGGRNYFQGNVGIGTDDPSYPLEVLTTNNVAAVSVRSEATADSSTGIYSFQAAQTGRTFGIEAQHGGVNLAGPGGGAGIWGYSNRAVGVAGWTSATQAGAGIGVWGSTSADIDLTAGVFGEATGATASPRGVWGKVTSSAGYAGYFEGGRNYFEGYVGIGIAEPIFPLEVTTVSGTAAYIESDVLPLVVEANADTAIAAYNTPNNIGGLYVSRSGVSGYSDSDQGFGIGGITNPPTDDVTAAGLAGVFRLAGNAGKIGMLNDAVYGEQVSGSTSAAAVRGVSSVVNGNGIIGEVSAGTVPYAIWGRNFAGSGYAGYFSGDVHVAGTLSKSGGSFKIDHPLDPANKYLSHSFVESPDMKNIYDGIAYTDEQGFATVELPEWFSALNSDFRYQLTVIKSFSRAMIAEEVDPQTNTFVIRTQDPGVKVSWQITGIRMDPWAQMNRIPTEENKPDYEQGFYLHPELYSLPYELDINFARKGQYPEVSSRPDIEMATVKDK